MEGQAMSDIVERLTDDLHMIEAAGLEAVASTVKEAATEITHLREALAEAEKVIAPFAELIAFGADTDEINDEIRAARRWMDGRK